MLPQRVVWVQTITTLDTCVCVLFYHPGHVECLWTFPPLGFLVVLLGSGAGGDRVGVGNICPT